MILTYYTITTMIVIAYLLGSIPSAVSHILLILLLLDFAKQQDYHYHHKSIE